MSVTSLMLLAEDPANKVPELECNDPVLIIKSGLLRYSIELGIAHHPITSYSIIILFTDEKPIGTFFNLSHSTYLEAEVAVSLAGDPERDCIEEALAIRSKEKEANFVIGTDLGGEGFSAD